jgi:hypothetical protein
MRYILMPIQDAGLWANLQTVWTCNALRAIWLPVR